MSPTPSFSSSLFFVSLPPFPSFLLSIFIFYFVLLGTEAQLTQTGLKLTM